LLNFPPKDHMSRAGRGTQVQSYIYICTLPTLDSSFCQLLYGMYTVHL